MTLSTAESSSSRPRRYAVLGTGAIGGYYGARLQKAGFEVHYLLHRDYAIVQQRGLRIESIQGDFTLPQVHGYDQTKAIPPVNVVIIALKTTRNGLLAELLPPLLGPDTVILTLQNGLDIEAEIAAAAPHQPILGGLCFICANKIGPGHIRHLDYGDILMGSYHPQRQAAGISPLLEAIAADFRTAGIGVDITPDLYLARWRKLVWNVPFNGLSVVLDATTEEMMADPSIVTLAEALMAEVVAAAAACGEQATPGTGRSLPHSLVAKMLAHTRTMKPYRTSMKIDYDEDRPLEVEAILGNPLRAAQQAGLPVPRMEMLYQQVAALDRRRNGAEAP
jgi:2-dehydropantoate 2-reductase